MNWCLQASKGLGWVSEPRATLWCPAAEGEPAEALAEAWGASRDADGDLVAAAGAALGLGLGRLRPLRPAEGVRSVVNLSVRCVFLGQCVFLGRGLTLCSRRR